MNSIEWRDGKLILLDQTLLPRQEVYLELDDYREVARAIKEMRVRGAPAIGVTAAYGVALGARAIDSQDMADFKARLGPVCDEIAASRPTAVNLRWAVDRMQRVFDGQMQPGSRQGRPHR